MCPKKIRTISIFIGPLLYIVILASVIKKCPYVSNIQEITLEELGIEEGRLNYNQIVLFCIYINLVTTTTTATSKSKNISKGAGY